MSRGSKWWTALSSMKMRLLLLVAVMVASAVGTVIPQGWAQPPVGPPFKDYVNSIWRYHHLLGQEEVIKLKVHSSFVLIGELIMQRTLE